MAKLTRAQVHKLLKEGSRRLFDAWGVDDIIPYLPRRPRRKWVRIPMRRGVLRARKWEVKENKRIQRRAQKEVVRKALLEGLELTTSFMKSLEKLGKRYCT